MKQYKTPEYPSNFLFFDTETQSKPVKGQPLTSRAYFWFGHLLAYRRENGRRTRIQDKTFHNPRDFWDTLIARLDSKRPLWVFAHNIIFDLTVCDAWQLADDYGISVELPVLDDPPVFMVCKHERGKVNFIDTFNYWKCSVADLGIQQGLKKLEMPKRQVMSQKWKDYCKRDVHVLAQAIDNLCEWLRSNDLGPLTFTIASTAMATYKHRFMPVQTIHIHDNMSMLDMERKAYHGGLTHAYFIGAVKEKIYKLDVNSLYPAMMLKEYPVKLCGKLIDTKPRELLKIMSKKGAVADVTIHSTDTPYPVHDGKRLLEGVGKFSTTLCGAELVECLRNGHIKAVHTAVLYECSPIFVSYVEYFYKKRSEYKRLGDTIGEQFCKLLMNSLYGKFGQRGFQWIDLTYDSLSICYELAGKNIPKVYKDERNAPVFGFGYHHWEPLELGFSLKLRNMYGTTQFQIQIGEHHESSPIIAAYVTSYARSYIRFLQRIAGRRNCYYTDTDSLFCNARGYKRLSDKGYVDSRKIGMLKLEETFSQISIYGPKDYVTPLRRTIKGIRRDAKPFCPACNDESDNGTICSRCGASLRESTRFRQLQFEHIKSILKRGPEPYIEIKQVVKELKREYHKGTVTKSGWTQYPILSLEKKDEV